MAPSDHNEPKRPLIFRWAGSKKQLVKSIVEIAKGVNFNTYIEPFVGSGAVFFNLRPEQSFISDNNKELINAYRIVKCCYRKLYEAVTSLPANSETYYRLRSQRTEYMNSFDRAVRFTFLNRHAFNGIYRTNKQGLFNVPMGKDSSNLPNIESFSVARTVLKNATIQRLDFRDACRGVPKKSLVYIDPPYDYTGRIDRGEYGVDSFTKKDLNELFDILQEIDKCGSHFIFSFIECKEVLHLNKKWNSSTLPVRRQVAASVNARKNINECLFRNF